MIKVTVSYPAGAGSTFNHDYYRGTHLPLVRSRVGSAIRRAEIDRATASGDPQGSAPTWMASGHLYFDSVESFQAAFGPHAAEILGDIPNFTNVEPYIVISETIDA
jgi:uncharacterized protein (TIGR02118 family)